MTISELYTLFQNQGKISTDTRDIAEGAIFFALKGDRFNGNLFAKQALEKGASYAVIDESLYEDHPKIIVVEDVLATLQQLANFHRKALGIPIIALTGSNGKTTTKELISSVLSQKYRTVATHGNLNNHIGVPLTLLTMDKDTEIGVVEMGANHLKEIEALCNIAEPDFGVITNFGKAHLEGFGSVEGVIRGKSELYTYLKANQKLIFVNLDDLIQMKQLGEYPKFYGFGKSKKTDCPVLFTSAAPEVVIEVANTSINSNLIGSYNYTNIAIAIAIGSYFKVSLKSIKRGIETYVPANNRSQILYSNGHKIILDAYNANPSSMEAAIHNLSALDDANKLAILGDMFELGSEAEIEHQRIADLLEASGDIEGILVGENFSRVKSDLIRFKTFEDLEKAFLKTPLSGNRTILIKGSRGMKLERMLSIIK